MTDRAPRSVSQLNQYNRCPYSYYLARIRKDWQRPAAWLPQGSAVHEAAEWWERTGRTGCLEDMQAVYAESFRKHVAEYTKITPNFEWWSKSGRYGAAQDIPRRFKIGLDQCAKYYFYYLSTPREVIWIAPDGTPGIELGFDIELDDVRLRGFIDCIIDRPLNIPVMVDGARVESEVIVRDNKTGNNPGDDLQLGVYSVAVAEAFGVARPLIGDYWMARAGKPTVPFDLTSWTRDRVNDAFADLEEQIGAGNFPPDPTPDKCLFCDVSHECKYKA
jgi:putative RecB family exonuclease